MSLGWIKEVERHDEMSEFYVHDNTEQSQAFDYKDCSFNDSEF